MLEHLRDRTCIILDGPDGLKFLQNLVTNDLIKNDWTLKPIVYTALLTSNGRYLFDFFVIKQDDDKILLDIHKDQKEQLVKTLSLYKLRSNFVLNDSCDLAVYWSLTKANLSGYTDPRLKNIGYRYYLTYKDTVASAPCYNQHRIRLGIPEYPHEFIQEKTIVLEMNFEELNGISFNKGCYIGQELMARTKHLGQIRKRLYVLDVSDGIPQYGEAVFNEKNEEIGRVYSVGIDKCLAVLYSEQITEKLHSMSASMTIG